MDPPVTDILDMEVGRILRAFSFTHQVVLDRFRSLTKLLLEFPSLFYSSQTNLLIFGPFPAGD